jgi:hypothetical protein
MSLPMPPMAPTALIFADPIQAGLRAGWAVVDGSLFPTSAHPQLSIYAISARLASGLAQSLTGKPATRVAA